MRRAAVGAFAIICVVGTQAVAFECPPPGYEGNADCGYQCGEGTCCGNPHYYGSYVFGTWRPDPRCLAKPVKRSLRKSSVRHREHAPKR